jgi:hypothetical protein
LAAVFEVAAVTFERDLMGAALELTGLAALELPELATLELLLVVAALELLALEAADLGGALRTFESAGVYTTDLTALRMGRPEADTGAAALGAIQLLFKS